MVRSEVYCYLSMSYVEVLLFYYPTLICVFTMQKVTFFISFFIILWLNTDSFSHNWAVLHYIEQINRTYSSCTMRFLHYREAKNVNFKGISLWFKTTNVNKHWKLMFTLI